MEIINNKNIIRTLLISSFIIINLLILSGLSSILQYLNSGASRAGMLHLEKETITTYLPKVTWEKLTNVGREMDKKTLKTIEKNYLFSWQVKNRAFEVNIKKGLKDFYTQKAQLNLFHAIDYNIKNKISIESTTIKHSPQLNFYSEDGLQIVFTDKNVVEFQKIYKDKKLITQIQDTATYKVMMLLEDGFWRVRHMVRMNPVPFTKDTLKSQAAFRIVDKKILHNNTEFVMKGINYYPKNTAWDTFGELFNKQTIAKDFDIIKKAKLNSIRIFIQYDDFGQANIKPEKLEKLKILLDLAQEKKLKVIVTLFDFYSDYSLQSWTLTHHHAEKIVSTFKNHKAIIAWDIKNEPNLDFENRDETNVINWLQHMITVVKEADPNHLITIGWSNATEAAKLEDQVDFVSYHFYNSIDDFENENQTLDKITKKPIVVGEFGIPSYNGFWNGWLGENENGQAQYHQKIQTVFKKNKIAFMSWTLYDFPNVPNQVAGIWPWQKLRQKKFGFIDEKGRHKPAFKYITY